MKRKKMIKNSLKILVLILIPLGIAWFVVDVINNLPVPIFQLSSDELAPLREVDPDALVGFDVFPVNRIIDNHFVDTYAISLVTHSDDVVPLFDDAGTMLEQEGIVSMATPQETIYVVFENPINDFGLNDQNVPNRGFIPIRETFILVLFYNYEQVEFRPINQPYFQTEFTFSLPQGHQVHIPIQLDQSLESNNDLNALTLAVFASPERHTIDRESDFWHVIFDNYVLNTLQIGIVENFLISYGGWRNRTLQDNIQEVVEERGQMTFGAMGFNNRTLENGMRPDDMLNVESWTVHSPVRLPLGQEVGVNFFGNPRSLRSSYWGIDLSEEIIEDYLFIALVNWEQAEINGFSYTSVQMFDETEYLRGHSGRLNVRIPDEAGLYEVIVFAIINPTSLNTTRVNQVFSDQIAHRFTVVVE